MKQCGLIVLYLIGLGFVPARPQDVSIVDGWYHIDGQKFFVKGIGYETHTRPGQVPWVYRFDADLIADDLGRIKAAGFNTIRSWAAMTEEELQVVEASGLKILFGIWIDPQGDYGDSGFRSTALGHVDDVLSYSSKYQSIIGYLIMNEPLVEHIHDAGSQALSDLWQDVADLISQKHPGIPVSFSNTIIGDFIDMERFGFAAYNAYIYNPVTISDSHGYAGFLRYLKDHRAASMPLIVTEFGLSVSPGPWNPEYGYGGNTLEQQTEGDLAMFRGLIDAGAQGGCVFQYHDGWWKAGNEFAHDPLPEEWFGLIGFSSLSDVVGTPRPVWTAFTAYNKAVIVQPKNGSIHDGTVPVELFAEEDVSFYTISWNGNLLLSEFLSGGHHESVLTLSLADTVQDMELNFDFFNSRSEILKSETITILYSRNTIVWPSLNVRIFPDHLNEGGSNTMILKVVSDPLFTIKDNTLDCAIHPHIGFDPGFALSRIVNLKNGQWSDAVSVDIPSDSKVTTFGAGYEIQYGTFTRRIVDQRIIINGDWADPIAAEEVLTGVKAENAGKTEPGSGQDLFQCYPNPFNGSTTFRFHLSGPGSIRLEIRTVLGKTVDVISKRFASEGWKEIRWDPLLVPSGVYVVRMRTDDEVLTGKLIVQK